VKKKDKQPKGDESISLKTKSDPKVAQNGKLEKKKAQPQNALDRGDSAA